MLPPDLAAFSFSLDAAGTDPALAARTIDAVRVAGGASVVVTGAQRWGLLAALARGGLDVTAFDPSRAVLALAKRALEDAGLADRVTLFASDPRDADVPGGADAALVPSAMWRMLLHEEGQRLTLEALGRALRGPSLLLLDVDRVPTLEDGVWTGLRDGPGRQRWSARRSGVTVTVRCESPGVRDVALDLAATTPDESAERVRAAGFDVVAASDAADGAPWQADAPRPCHADAARLCHPDAVRLWLVARKTGRPRSAPR